MDLKNGRISLVISLTLCALLIAGCGAEPATNTTVNVNANAANTNANSIVSNTNTTGMNSLDAVKEPSDYQATVSLKLEAVGDQKRSEMPTLGANVARSGNDRRMEFAMPAGGRVVFLDKGGSNYLILPDKKQYAELNQESLGFEVRRMMMPEQIVEQVKAIPGVQFVGEETYNGRTVQKFSYGAVAETQTQAGQVTTESYLLVDKETGLPLRSETQSQSQSGGNVQGFTGVRIITEISDIKTATDAAMFELPPADYQKIETSQVRAHVDMLFNALASFVGQLMQQNQPPPATSPTASPTR
jgi:hypothetical protein